MRILNAEATADLLPYERLIPAVRQAMLDLHAGLIHASPRTVLPLPEGGTYLAMPCTDARYAVTKLVAVTPANRERGQPTIQGRVVVSEAGTGTPLIILDGIVVTARRTAAVTLLGIETLLGRAPESVVMVGTGAQALTHALAMGERWPGVQLRCVGRGRAQSMAFAASLAAQGLNARVLAIEQALEDAAVVVTATTSLTSVLPDEIPPDTLIVGLGSFTPQMAELPAKQIRQRQVWVDDLEGARHEAGDLLQAGVDWSRVHTLAEALSNNVLPRMPMLLKTVGHAAWDLAAVRTALVD
ncbi:delta(1)-pyrroline-2-carboxylate reductase family protein [Roseateles oligotrophus]|uniref:Delta(1)-pyrroline-2-carboxylate reductase family protein n=1 Tax=Roseateles oligotrophus TaxID=1769250 RepID=A0ABT2YJD1_9BURK|nr:delta(1)-pyrroline-2-carboxylate reductase family protein [Roseateles oligotrophus]MCV2370030.1 delta(1)-pyrroline-2-carboxylate reductase family protein [Roseateles oligotrophus]